MGFVEEINWRTYQPNVYFSSVNALSATRSRIGKQSASNSSNRSSKRINYSLTDLENKIYNQNESNGNGNSDKNHLAGGLDRYSQAELLKSNKRFMELDTENFSEIRGVPHLMSVITGVHKDRIDEASSGISGSSAAGQTSSVNRRTKFELPKNMQHMYRCTRPPVPKRKNTNRIIALKKTLSSRRQLSSYLDALDNLNRSIIYNNVYNKKFLKVLPVITVCSICGGYKGISSCVRCKDKICSLKCYTLHNETRCSR
ncbi:HHL263Wp [Eremothecium sinecaudum]|uniref:HHL263Wp n=1 Tax=Eremothecium sinecaudum TaxID=45286 RepID=A0A0X8HVX6_9SACH|nr:HHL263Wp [Eremothecium sinecaudum]AMD22507.1 HHL263Wp [Eremothecium sinecaudum]